MTSGYFTCPEEVADLVLLRAREVMGSELGIGGGVSTTL